MSLVDTMSYYWPKVASIHVCERTQFVLGLSLKFTLNLLLDLLSTKCVGSRRRSILEDPGVFVYFQTFISLYEYTSSTG